MIKSIIAYNLEELQKKKILAEAKILYKSKVLSEVQWQNIKKAYASKLFSPTIFMRILLFILTYIGLSTMMGPFVLIFGGIGDNFLRIIAPILGFLFLYITEKVFIKDKYHYKSGVTEAGIFAGLSFIAIGIFTNLSLNLKIQVIYPIVLFFLSLFAAVRYLNLLTLILSVFFLGWIIFQILNDLGSTTKALIPFLFILCFALLYWISRKLQTKYPNVIFQDQFIILKSLSLFAVYISGNYFVVREISIELMGITLSQGKDIPYAFLFYFFTVAMPIAYIAWGIIQKSILHLRVGLFITALSVITFKYYFSLGHPEVTITIVGATLMAVSLILFKYLKEIRNGFTREMLLQDKWSSKNLTAIIASQSLGGNQLEPNLDEDTVFKGGEFGGGGAGSDF